MGNLKIPSFEQLYWFDNALLGTHSILCYQIDITVSTLVALMCLTLGKYDVSDTCNMWDQKSRIYKASLKVIFFLKKLDLTEMLPICCDYEWNTIDFIELFDRAHYRLHQVMPIMKT